MHREVLQPADTCKQAMLHYYLLPGSRCSGQPGHIAVNRLKKHVFPSFFSHFIIVANGTAGLLGISGYFLKKWLCSLSDQGAHNLFTKVAEHLKSVNLVEYQRDFRIAFF